MALWLSPAGRFSSVETCVLVFVQRTDTLNPEGSCSGVMLLLVELSGRDSFLTLSCSTSPPKLLQEHSFVFTLPTLKYGT